MDAGGEVAHRAREGDGNDAQHRQAYSRDEKSDERGRRILPRLHAKKRRQDQVARPEEHREERNAHRDHLAWRQDLARRRLVGLIGLLHRQAPSFPGRIFCMRLGRRMPQRPRVPALSTCHTSMPGPRPKQCRAALPPQAQARSSPPDLIDRMTPPPWHGTAFSSPGPHFLLATRHGTQRPLHYSASASATARRSFFFEPADTMPPLTRTYTRPLSSGCFFLHAPKQPQRTSSLPTAPLRSLDLIPEHFLHRRT